LQSAIAHFFRLGHPHWRRPRRAHYVWHCGDRPLEIAMTGQTEDPDAMPRSISIFGREIPMPRSRWLRIAIGVALVLFGFLGFLPILGFWMVPLGLVVLSYEFAAVRRWRRRMVVWWERRKRPN
jgi:hypothetical protein